MNSEAEAVAALIAAVEQRLLVAVLQRDEAAMLTARSEIVRLRKQFPPQVQREALRPAAHSAPLEASAPRHRN